MTEIRLKANNAREVRRTLTRVINLAANRKIDTKTANTIILGCNAILSAIRIDEQDKKIMELQEILNETNDR